MNSPNYFLGLDLGGTSVKGVAVTPDGETLAKFHESFALAEPMAFAEGAMKFAPAGAQWGSPIRRTTARHITD